MMVGINNAMKKIMYYENILEFKENTKEVLNMSEINNWKLCRTCLVNTDENNVNINNMSIMDAMRGTILNIKEMLAEITRMNISKTENLPLQVCNECFNKITELYYFRIQIHKAEQVLIRLANTLKDNKPLQESCEANIEIYQDMASPSDIARISIDENEDSHYELPKPDLKESTENFSAKSVLENNEISVFNSEKPPLPTELENEAEPNSTSSDVESNSENTIIEYLEYCDTDNEGHATDFIEETTQESVEYELKKIKLKPSKTSTTGYRHKQPRVTSPLLDDFDCAICHISYWRQQELIQHVRDSHPNSKAFKCRVCGNLFSHIQSLSRHMNNHKEDVVLNECKYCSKQFVRADDLKRHSRVHTGERPYVCPICEKSFQQQFDLKCHQKKHDFEDNNLQPRIYECTHCKKGYTSRTGLNWHKKRHHSQESDSHESLHYCLMCSKPFKREYDVKRHSIIHHPADSNKCTDCEKIPSLVEVEEHEDNLSVIDERD